MLDLDICHEFKNYFPYNNLSVVTLFLLNKNGKGLKG